MPKQHSGKRGQSMVYKLVVSEHADELLDPHMDYIVIFDVREDTVNVVGVFHQLENYQSKL